MEPLTLETILRLIVGCVVLVAGRNVFWLFVGLMGFLVGVEFAEIWLVDEPRLLVIAAAAGAGLLGALLAILYERVAFALAGFTAMAYLAMVLAKKIGFDSAPPAIVFVAGLVGAILAALIMDWAIIVLSSLAGAAAIVSTFTSARAIDAVVFVILATIGISVQHTVLTRRRRS
jgi:hypothetical protein